ncbi:MAG: hypothetical protein HKO62_03860 [Gammaproteobacteria bacterium]|nr:hypothetical protein [Gammaproteobacteria bacterium]NNL99862.1 hypothetical protein [Gammaproteobacteria bacterium]
MKIVAGIVFATGLAISLVISLLPVSAAPTQAPVDVMHEVYEAVAYLLPLSVRDPEHASEWDQELIDSRLATLRDSSQALLGHAQQQDLEFGLLARSFDRTVADLTAAFADRWPAYAYFSMMDLTQYCAACHSRLPSDAQAVFGQKLLARMDLRTLDDDELARLYVALRQFRLAAGKLEERLLDPALHPIDADLDGTYVQFLDVSLDANGDFERAWRVLAKVAQRPDLPYYLAQRLKAWQNAIDEVGTTLAGPAELADARAWFDKATVIGHAPADATRAVYDLAAAQILQRLLDQGLLQKLDKAEAYYTLGVITLRTTERRPAVPEMELLMEAAIRTAPGSSYARYGYALLEEFGYTGEGHLASQQLVEGESAFIDMAELRQLIELGTAATGTGTN